MDIPTFFPQSDVIWKVSAAWASRSHDCTLAGIVKKCGGMCCSSPAFWPPKAFNDPNVADYGDVVVNGMGKRKVGFSCGHLTEFGCKFSPADKPVTCLLYPFVLNKHNTLVCHNRITTGHGICKGNHNNGPMIIDVVRDNLIALFGEKQVDHVRADVAAGKDSYFLVSEDLLRQYNQENEWANENVKPIARSDY